MKRRDFIKLSSAGAVGASMMDSKAGMILKDVWDAKPKKARFLWFSKDGKGRNLHACFRKSFTLSETVKSAEICIFADTVYQLFINGQFVQFGPVRFDPRFPVYDKHDIAKYLKPGKNVIAVAVNYYGMKVFKAIASSGGFVAWGNARSEKESISFDTTSGAWKAIANKAYSKYASKISFALNPRDVYDQSLEEAGWKTIDFDDSKWPNAMELANQEIWGSPSERPIPFLSGEPIEIPKIKHLLPLLITEDIYSFTLPSPAHAEKNKKDPRNFYAYSTWIFSPVAQSVTVGIFYGENWLNGQPVAEGIHSEKKSMRINQIWNLKQGWNFFFGKVGIYSDAINVFFGFPKDHGIILAPDKKPDSEYSFKYLAIEDSATFERFIAPKSLPFAPDDELKEVGGWKWQKKSDRAYDSAWDTSWDSYSEQPEKITAQQIDGFIFKKELYPNGFSILFDMESMHLAIPEIDIEGIQGSIVDLTYSEHISPDDQHLKYTFNYTGADRLFCSRDRIQWNCSNPRGMRYFMITVRNTKSDVTFRSLKLRSAHYPVTWKGSFTCSDPLLNSIWQMCALTQATDMTDAYVDCDGREQGMYIRDTIIQYVNNTAIFGDHALMARCLELYGQSPDKTGKFRAVYPNTGDYTISDFALNMLEGYHVYYKNTNDKKRISADWQAMMKNLQWFHQLSDEREDKLLDAEWDKKRGINAHYGGFHGDLAIKKDYMSIQGIHCVFSCTYLIAMKCAIEMAHAIGKTEDAEALQKRADILKKNIQKFWNPAKKAYADNLDFTTHSHHASLFAVRADVATPEQIEDIKKHVAFELRSIFVNGYSPSDGNYASPSFAFYIFDGLYRLGLAKTAEDMMRTGWGWFLFQGCKTTPEYFTLNASLCHAWSASPMYYLSTNVLGVHFPKAPDMNYAEIKVQTHHVSFAEGKFPHPKGLIEVKWHTDDKGKRVFDYVKAPDGVEIKIVG